MLLSELRSFEFTIDGEPVAKGRPRFEPRGIKGGGTRMVAVTDDVTRTGEQWVQAAFSNAYPGNPDPLTGNVLLVVVFYTKHTGKNSWGRKDLDNLIKLVSDALNKKAYKDDSQIVHIDAELKRDYPGEPYTYVQIMEIPR